MIDQTIKITKLFDAYGDLLTDRQKKCIELHYLDDLSLSEVAEQFEVSRQAVHDILKRSVQIMEDFEQKLTLVAKNEKQEQIISEIDKLLGKAIAQYGESVLLSELKEKIGSLR